MAKKQLSDVTFLGPIGRFLQVLFVTRETASSRKDTLNLIKVRSRRNQITYFYLIKLEILFSESSNESKLLWKYEKLASNPYFSRGHMYKWSSFNQIQNWSFSGMHISTYDAARCTFILQRVQRNWLIFSKPGCAVQPILIRRDDPMALDTITWTYYQAFGFTGCLWLTLCQFNTSVSVSTKWKIIGSKPKVLILWTELLAWNSSPGVGQWLWGVTLNKKISPNTKGFSGSNGDFGWV